LPGFVWALCGHIETDMRFCRFQIGVNAVPQNTLIQRAFLGMA
jgi:hypothetical protein